MILFLCPHGGAKSVLASHWFNRLAEEHGLPERGLAAAADTPYEAVPPPVTELLARDGLDVHEYRPRRVETEDVRAAEKVVSIDCDLSALDLTGTTVERWDDVPKVSDDIDAAAAAIRRHVAALVEALRGGG